MAKEVTPSFQKIQQAFAEHLRNPQEIPYDDELLPEALPIEPRRMALYESLFFNNVDDFFSSQFPVLKDVLGKQRWLEIMREYMVKHRAKTPLFHELGQEFLEFLQSSYEPKDSDPKFIFELAHYEWVEVALATAMEVGFQNPVTKTLDIHQYYEVSPIAWPLSYQWPVHDISAELIPNEMPEKPTTLLVYRDTNDQVKFLELTPMLYQLIVLIDEHRNSTFQEIIMMLAEAINQPVDRLLTSVYPALEMLYTENVIRPIT